MPIYLIIIISIIGIIVLYELCELLYKQTKRYKNSLGGAYKLRNVPKGIEICNIGSGPGLYSISYDNCDKKGFNFSTAPQNYKNGFRLLKRFKDDIMEDAIIIIIIMCPLSFGKNNDYNKPNYMDKFYGILPKEDIDGYSLKRLWIVNHPLTIWIINFIKKVFKKIFKVNKSKKSLFVNELPTVINWKNEFDLQDLKDPTQSVAHQEAFKEKINILDEGVGYCLNNKWKPIFVIPPIPKQTREYISDEFLNEFVYKNLEVIQKKYKDIKTLNYFSDSRFTNEYFNGDIFVNEKGKNLFSKILFNDLKEI